MKVRFLSLFMCIVLICGAVMLSSCNKTTEEIVVEEIEKIIASENVKGSTSMVANGSLEGEGVTLSDSFEFQVNGNDTENEVYLATGRFAGTKVSVYKESSYYYIEALNKRVKVESDEDSDKIYGLYQYSKDIIKPVDFTRAMEYKIEDRENGDKVITVTMRPADFRIIYKSHIAYAMGVEESKVEKGLVLTNCYVVITLRPDNTIFSYQISYSSVESTYFGDVDIRVSAQNIYTAYGKKAEVVITPPENYTDFDEIN